MDKRGYFFLIDAIIGVIIMISAAMYFYNIQQYEQPKDQLFLLTDSIITVFTTTKIALISTPFIDKLRMNGNITNTENTIVEQLNEFEYREKNGCSFCRNLSRDLIRNITDGIIEQQFNFRISLNNVQIYEQSRYKESSASNTINLGMIAYTTLNGSSIYGPSYAEITLWQ